MRKFIFITLLFLLAQVHGFAQTDSKMPSAPSDSKANLKAVKSSPAYAELLLRKVEREAQLEELAPDYTDEFPKVKEIKFELSLISQALERILAVKPAESGKLTLALGKLLVRKTELGTDLWSLHQQFTDERPEVKRLRRKIEIYEQAIKEILL
ncbi:MAG: hypothetical protein M3T96_00705 [Acidobacteriota bacterium]|nr:hypothetical protein [Acidobacteriota bacterium]